MPDYVPQLGSAPTTKDTRDAIHFPVLPARAGQRLYPAQHVALNDKMEAVADGTHIAIVDPFLKGPVMPDDPVWLMLYPGTIHSLRHAWSHPHVPDAENAPSMDAEAVLREAAEAHDVTLDTLLEACDDYVNSGGTDWHMIGFDLPDTDWKDIWPAWERYTGRKAPEGAYSPFSCSC